ncbi:hypothetical protein Nmel_013747 [Mimus melanotis]
MFISVSERQFRLLGSLGLGDFCLFFKTLSRKSPVKRNSTLLVLLPVNSVVRYHRKDRCCTDGICQTVSEQRPTGQPRNLQISHVLFLNLSVILSLSAVNAASICCFYIM